jgi:hypothetical protein
MVNSEMLPFAGDGKRALLVAEAEPTPGRTLRRVLAGVFGLGAFLGLLLGLAIGPTGAALIGFKLPYFRLALADPAPSKPKPSAPHAPVPAVPIKDPVPAAAGPVQQVSLIKPRIEAQQPLTTPAGRPLTIGVFGDSMGDGLWSALYRDLHKENAVDVLRLARNSTGLTRYDYVDVQAQTQSQLADHHVDVAVVMFGANDGQGIIQDGKVYAFGTPGWRQAYSARIDALVNLLRSQGAAVYWVGLPRMEKPDVDRRAALLNSIYQERAAALGVPFIDTVPVTVDAQGRYDAYLSDPSDAHRRLMRAPDGIHMTMAGYLRLAGPVVARLRQDIASAEPAAAHAPIRPAAAALEALPPLPMRPPPEPSGPVATAAQP